VVRFGVVAAEEVAALATDAFGRIGVVVALAADID
jgi:hypothetical protein